MTRCSEVLVHVYEYINRNDLAPGMVEEIRVHLEVCRPCFTRYEFEQNLLQHIKKTDRCCCPESLKKKIKAIVDLF